MLLLGRQGACERLCVFLLDLAERLPKGEAMTLPMSRQDMADYLGLTIETVSRTLTQLQGAGWIELPAIRRIVLSNRAAIRRVCN
jgi:CRP/FNR family nitrogen fixation transcriptional regulator